MECEVGLICLVWVILKWVDFVRNVKDVYEKYLIG